MTSLDLAALFSFADTSDSGSRTALRLRIGPLAGHHDLTFSELARKVREQAGMLYASGVRPGERVALLLPHSERLVVNFLAAIWVGCVPSIVAWPTAKMDPEKYRRNLHAVLHSLKASCLATDPATAGRLVPFFDATRVIDGTVAGAASDASHADIRLGGTGFIQFSGGTTGVQKSVPIPFEHLRRQLASLKQTLEITPDDAVISWLPLYHDMGLVACLLLPFLLRLPVTMFSPMEWVMDPRPYLRAIGETRSTLTWLPNFAFSFMARRARFAPGEINLSSMRAFVNCSEPVRADSVDAFRDAFAPHGLRASAVHTSYAMAEATFAVTQTTERDPPRRFVVSNAHYGAGRLFPEEGGRVLVSCGRAVPNVDVRIVDDGGAPITQGAIGQVQLRGPFIMDDYLDAETSDLGARWAFADGWYQTGDLGAIVNEHLFVTGRRKDVIIVGGVNVYPEDIEAAVGEVARVRPGRVVALGLEADQAGTERLIVVAEVDGEGQLAHSDAVEEDARRTILAVAGTAAAHVFVVPPKWIVKSTAGKISRPETRAKVLARWDELTRGVAS